MMTQKEVKGAKYFYCETCNYKCCSNYNYNRHKLTAKHQMLSNAVKNAVKNEKKNTPYL